MPPRPALDTLRARIAAIEVGSRVRREVLPFEVAALDACLPGGGLARGALHEVAGGADGVGDGAAATLFAAGIVARAGGQVLLVLDKRNGSVTRRYLDAVHFVPLESGTG
mgnify:CR=1 FL=1